MNAENDKFKKIDDQDKSEIIDHIYQVALNPEQYETLLDIWEEKLSPFRSLPSFGENSFEDIDLAGHTDRAGIFLDRSDANSQNSVLADIVSNIYPSAAFICDQSNQVISANAAASSLFDIRENSNINSLDMPEETLAQLKAGFENLIKNPHKSHPIIKVSLNHTGKTIAFKIQSIKTEFTDENFILIVSSQLAWPEGLSHTISESFGLTKAEIQIVRLISEGNSLKEISEERGRALDTVKTQLRSILSKTETRTQSELIRMTLGLMDVVTATESNAILKTNTNQSQGKLKDREFRTLMRSDGKRADHIVIGAENGRPVLYFPLDYGLIRWPATAERYAEKNNFKIIVPIRPGYGNSSPANKSSETLDMVCENVLDLLEHYHVKQCPVICMSTDTYFAYHFANRHPGRLTAIYNCAPGFPMFLPQQYERMEKWHRFILANARYAPSLLPFLVKAGFSLAKRIGKRGFVHAVYGNSPADVETFENPEVFEAMIVGSEVCLSDWHSAHNAFSYEVIIQQSDWSDLIHNCKIPVHVWHGDDDPQVPAETVEEIKNVFKNVTYERVENAGQLVLFKIWKTVLEKIESDWENI